MSTFQELCEDAASYTASAIRRVRFRGSRREAARQEIRAQTPAVARAVLMEANPCVGAAAAVVAVIAKKHVELDGDHRALAARIAEGFLAEQEVEVDDGVLVLVGVVGAAAAVVVVVGTVRSGIAARGRKPSEDIRLLAELARRTDVVGDSARILQRAVLTPWSFSFADAVNELSGPRHGAFVDALVERGRAGPAVRVGDMLDANRAQPAGGEPTTDGGPWLVVEVAKGGSKLKDGPVLHRGVVRTVTTDWEVLRTHQHPVSAHVCEVGRGYLSDDPAYRRIWRVSQGLLDPGRLRDAFDEPSLQEWAASLGEALRAGAASGELHHVAKEGQRYQPLLMLQRGAAVLGDAVVTRVVSQGFAAPGGLALLPAVVEVARAT